MRKKRQYDLPLQQRLGTEFLLMLIALMTLMASLASVVSLSLSGLSASWREGLENTLTVEIPVAADATAPAAARQEMAKRVLNVLLEDPAVLKADILSDADYDRLLSPWLGSGVLALETLPIPAMVTITLKERSPVIVERIADTMKNVAPEARVDTNETWLRDLANLARGVNAGAIALIGLMGFVTVLCIDGAVRSRMAVHHAELELLHLMGARDDYILRQFQRYILSMAVRGLLIGLGGAALVLGGFEIMGRYSEITLPRLAMTPVYLIIPVAVSTVMLGLCTFAARRTVLRVLSSMP